MSQRPWVIVVDDEGDIRSSTAEELEYEFEVSTVSDVGSLESRTAERSPACLVVDLDDDTGVAILESHGKTVPVVAFSWKPIDEARSRGESLGARVVMPRGDLWKVVDYVKQALA